MRGVDRARDLYQVLQVDPRAEPEVVEAAYRRLARKYHPDVSDLADRGQRMKDLNAAYEVLHDPARRSAYDRERLSVTAGIEASEAADDGLTDESPSTRHPQQWLACRQHASTAAVGTCCDCGAGLCGHCFDRFQPPSCPNCIVAWARHRRVELLLPVLWFFIVLALGGYLTLSAFEAHALPQMVIGLPIATYVVAGLPSGWRLLGVATSESLLADLAWAAGLGTIIAPFRIGKAIWDLRQLGRLESLARSSA